MRDVENRLLRLEGILAQLGETAIAVSGGIDSLTLATVACRQNRDSRVFHAISPAVPKRATQRVQELAHKHDWPLTIFDAGEFQDPSYRQNPVNRCFFCKGNLYQAIAEQTDLPILSGTNLDDLDDFRPGLIAAQQRGVRHPFVEAKIDKPTIRAIARTIGLETIADLPAAPCLSSRVKTGIRIKAQDLDVIERVEAALQPLLGAVAARCRLGDNGFHIEIDGDVLTQMEEPFMKRLLETARAELRPTDNLDGVRAYRQGSAFVHSGSSDA